MTPERVGRTAGSRARSRDREDVNRRRGYTSFSAMARLGTPARKLRAVGRRPTITRAGIAPREEEARPKARRTPGARARRSFPRESARLTFLSPAQQVLDGGCALDSQPGGVRCAFSAGRARLAPCFPCYRVLPRREATMVLVGECRRGVPELSPVWSAAALPGRRARSRPARDPHARGGSANLATAMSSSRSRTSASMRDLSTAMESPGGGGAAAIDRRAGGSTRRARRPRRAWSRPACRARR